MNNEEKILGILEQMHTRMEKMDGRMEKMETDIVAIKDDIEVIKEDTEITRGATNTLLKWAESVELLTHVKLFPSVKE